MYEIHWTDYLIYEYDEDNKNIYDLEDSGLTIVEWRRNNVLITLIFESEENTLLMWRWENENEEE